MLRSKIECGMGTVPINPKLTIQTWDGVLSGDRLLTMACSDKIMRWNVIGMQVTTVLTKFTLRSFRRAKLTSWYPFRFALDLGLIFPLYVAAFGHLWHK